MAVNYEREVRRDLEYLGIFKPGFIKVALEEYCFEERFGPLPRQRAIVMYTWRRNPAKFAEYVDLLGSIFSWGGDLYGERSFQLLEPNPKLWPEDPRSANLLQAKLAPEMLIEAFLESIQCTQPHEDFISWLSNALNSKGGTTESSAHSFITSLQMQLSPSEYWVETIDRAVCQVSGETGIQLPSNFSSQSKNVELSFQPRKPAAFEPSSSTKWIKGSGTEWYGLWNRVD
jgi:hypothetical protein